MHVSAKGEATGIWGGGGGAKRLLNKVVAGEYRQVAIP